MSLYIDIMYLKRIAVQLPDFKQKSEYLWNCKCILCGDGSHHKTRGYFFKYNNKIFYKCHHCSASLTFGQFLRQLDPILYGEYAIEVFADENTNITSLSIDEPSSLSIDEPSSLSIFEELSTIAVSLDMVDDDNPAKIYCQKRKIPESQFSKLWYLEHTKDIIKLYPRYGSRKKYEKTIPHAEEPRLLIPFTSRITGKLIGVSLRALDDNFKRYIIARDETEEQLIFGWDTIDRSKPVTVVEGPLDSLFLDNCIAVGGTSFDKIEPLDIENPIIVFDNQPRNKEVCKIIEKFVQNDYQVCIWPCDIQGKDINELVLNGYDPAKIIQENTYQGLIAQIKFNEWRNC